MDCGNLYDELCSFRNLELAFRKARKNKRCRKDVQDFEFNLEKNLLRLKSELESLSYRPKPLKQFVIRDPKTRLISASHFRDRVVHHALCNIIQPIFERSFIHDSYANRINKGSGRAIERFDSFKRKASRNGKLLNRAKDGNMVMGYVLKADIRHFFDTVDHKVLMNVIGKKIKDDRVLALVGRILCNHVTKQQGKGMPIGNLTSQFFANLYLDCLDHFVKHDLGARFYVRYVDDFVILHQSRERLQEWKTTISEFLRTVKLKLHPEKSKIYPIHKGTAFLGYRHFYHFRLIRKSNLRTLESRMEKLMDLYLKGVIEYEKVIESYEGWSAYAKQANSYNLRRRVIAKLNSDIKLNKCIY